MAALAGSAAADRLLAGLRETGALLEGHFLLSSGRHAGRYVQCARLLQHPERSAAACADLAGLIRADRGEERPFDLVVGPAMGAVTLAYELARALGVRGLFAERVAGGGFALRRGFSVAPGERVLVAEDVVTTGRSVGEVLELLADLGAGEVAVASLVNRSGGDAPFGGTPYYRLADLEVPSWPAAECPLCADPGTGPAVKPGSRPEPE
ncbi:MAG: orotate phosphoribosyltransferase [Planctomycetota bacterium]|nr:MAG: orotate phosphoribosyltransferase [Planctomycetota bacterium]